LDKQKRQRVQLRLIFERKDWFEKYYIQLGLEKKLEHYALLYH